MPDVRAAFAMLTTMVVACGCASVPKVPLDEGPREYVASDYGVVRRFWTREKSLVNFDDLDNVLTVTATYESWDFRWAYVVRYAEDYRLTVEQRRALLETSLAESRQQHQFYVAVHAQKVRYADLTQADPAWIVRLIDDQGTETAPAEVQAIRRPGAVELTYFPYTSPWRKAFRIRFPRIREDGRPSVSPRAKWFGLRFAGAKGNQELIWEIERTTE